MKNKIGWCNGCNKISNAYIAGFFDGEGSAHIITIKRKEKKFPFQLRPHIDISQKDKFILEKIKKYLGYGKVGKNYFAGAYKYFIVSHNVILRFIDDIGKYTVIKKQQLELLREMINIANKKKNVPYVKDELERIIDIRDKLHTLNQTNKKLKYSREEILNATDFINIKDWNKKRSTRGKEALNKYAKSIKLPRTSIYCECGCGEKLIDRDNKGRLRRYINGHNQRGKHWNWR